jgi:hypothetical protein
MAVEAELRIRNDDDAWEIFQRAVENSIELSPDLKIVWDGWPVINIYLPNVPEDGTISTSMMSAILELQVSIYRTHALLTRGDSNLRRLTRIEFAA